MNLFLKGGEDMKFNKGFTLIELLVVIGIIAILTAAVTIAVNPGRQFAQARDTQRRADISALVNGVYHYATDNNGNLPIIYQHLLRQHQHTLVLVREI
jgi:prepilin-type N-terminal cleavage/methylation domain-containing protein